MSRGDGCTQTGKETRKAKELLDGFGVLYEEIEVAQSVTQTHH